MTIKLNPTTIEGTNTNNLSELCQDQLENNETANKITKKLTAYAVPFTTESFKDLYDEISEAFEELYSPIEVTETYIETKSASINNLDDLDQIPVEKLKVGSRIEFETEDETLKGKLYIGHKGDIIPLLKEGLTDKVVEYDQVEVLKHSAKTTGRIIGAMILASIPVLGWAAAADQGRRIYNDLNANAHFTLELTPLKEVEASKAAQYQAFVETIKN
ncbi:MAG: hypothetical protein ABIC91_03700 [Nanoarchaeota archaeon]|nr:hypothetical protein [Nanoarchaeota archaeon]MBU1031159.1 hypothetical protein [Nanoarchaeota archaeon]MBU1850415.1 hypothetical protein [Nanoarchaeota archaeon]